MRACLLIVLVAGSSSMARAENLFTKDIQEFGAMIQDAVDENARMRQQIRDEAGFDTAQTPTHEAFNDQDAPEEVAVPATFKHEASMPESNAPESNVNVETILVEKIKAAVN